MAEQNSTLASDEKVKTETEQLEEIKATMLLSNVEDAQRDVPVEKEETDSTVKNEDDVDKCAMDTETTESTAIIAPHFVSRSLVEVARSSWENPQKQHYLNGCLWSPDGTCVLTAVKDDGMHVLEMPRDLYGCNQVAENRSVDLLSSAVHVPEAGLVYDYVWYPGMSSLAPETCLWLATCSHEPIHMWDAFTGKLRCSYKGYNSVDEVEAAYSVLFTTDGGSIYAGYKKSIKGFDVSVPGRENYSVQMKSTPSCLAVSYTHPDMLLFGSWNRSLRILDVRTDAVLNVGNYSTERSHKAGLTRLQFIPYTDWFVSGARKDSRLLLWDTRKLTEPIGYVTRSCDTNQRIYFDVSADGKWLVSGDTDGVLHAWNLQEIDPRTDTFREVRYPVYKDCCNGVSFHPSMSIVATASGQHHGVPVETEEEPAPTVDGVDVGKAVWHHPPSENCLTLWWDGNGTEKNPEKDNGQEE